MYVAWHHKGMFSQKAGVECRAGVKQAIQT